MRPEPPPDSRKPVVAAPTLKGMTKEEVRALLSVGVEEQRSRANLVFRRARWIVIPTGIVGALIHFLFGEYSVVAILAITASVILWSAWPLIRRDEWS